MVIEWLLIAIFVIVGLAALKLEHHAKKIIIIIIIGFIIYFSVVNHFNSNEVDLSSPSGIINGVYLYAGWVGQTATSLWDIGTDTASLVGNAVKMNTTQEEKPRR